MAQVTSQSVANGSGLEVRNALNLVLAALFSGNSGTTAPTTTVPGMVWVDTSGGELVLKIRNKADDGWLSVPVGDAAAVRTFLELVKGAAADYRANTDDRVLMTDEVWSAMAEVTLTDAASIALDLSSGFDFTVTLGGNRTLANPTNAKVGQRGRIRVVQDATGSRTLSFGTSYEFRGGVAAVLTTAANAQDVLYYDVISSTRILISSVLDIS